MNCDQEKLNKMDIYPHNIEEVMIEYRKSLEQSKFGMCGDSIQCNYFNSESVPGLRIRVPYAGARLSWDFLLDGRNPYRSPDVLFGWAHADFDPPLISLPSLETWSRSASSDNPWIVPASSSGRSGTLATLLITLIAELSAAYRVYSIEQLRTHAPLWPGSHRFLAALAQLQANELFEPADLELFLNHSPPIAAARLAVASNASGVGAGGSANGGDPSTTTNATCGLPAEVLLQLQIRLPFHISADADKGRSSGPLHSLSPTPASPIRRSPSAESLSPRPVLRLCFKSLDPLRYTAVLLSNPRLERALHASAAELQALVPKPPAPVPGGVQWLSFGIVDLVENVLGSFYSRTDKLLESARTRRAFIQELLAQHQGAVLEYDAENFLSISFLFDINDFFFIFNVRLPADFPHPREPPQLLLQSVYHERVPASSSQSSAAARATAPAPAIAVFRDCPYSPRWPPRELATRLLSYAHDCGINFYNDTHGLPFI